MDGCLGRDIIPLQSSLYKMSFFFMDIFNTFSLLICSQILVVAELHVITEKLGLLVTAHDVQTRGNSSLFLVGTCPWEFEIGSIHIPTLQEKVTHSYTNGPILGHILTKLLDFFFKLS